MSDSSCGVASAPRTNLICGAPRRRVSSGVRRDVGRGWLAAERDAATGALAVPCLHSRECGEGAPLHHRKYGPLTLAKGHSHSCTRRCSLTGRRVCRSGGKCSAAAGCGLWSMLLCLRKAAQGLRAHIQQLRAADFEIGGGGERRPRHAVHKRHLHREYRVSRSKGVRAQGRSTF